MFYLNNCFHLNTNLMFLFDYIGLYGIGPGHDSLWDASSILGSKWERLNTDTEALPSLFVIGDAGITGKSMHKARSLSPGPGESRFGGMPTWPSNLCDGEKIRNQYECFGCMQTLNALLRDLWPEKVGVFDSAPQARNF